MCACDAVRHWAASLIRQTESSITDIADTGSITDREDAEPALLNLNILLTNEVYMCANAPCLLLLRVLF